MKGVGFMEINKKIEALKLGYALRDANDAIMKLAAVYFDIGLTTDEMNKMAAISDALDELDHSYDRRFEEAMK
jgi:hypothetical protein